MTEEKLDFAFANHLIASPQFASWVLGRTKFSDRKDCSRPLHIEQQSARVAKHWYKHWWCHVPELNTESETDVFVAFEHDESKERFALHIENKLHNSTFQPNQAQTYAFRARHMLANTKSAILRCTDFDTILIAPRVFRDNYRTQCDMFGSYISHEEIAEFVPEFNY